MSDKRKDKPELDGSQHFRHYSKRVIKEMQAAVDAAWNDPDPAVQAEQRRLFPNGKPSVDEFIRVIADQIKKEP